MKTFIIIFTILLSATIASAGEIGKNVTLSIANQADSKTVRVEIYRINVEDKTIWARLYDTSGNIIEDKRVYSYGSAMPFTIAADEINYLDGQDPDAGWEIETIRLWLDDRQAKDDKGAVSAEDPYYYEAKDTKETLLNQISAILG